MSRASSTWRRFSPGGLALLGLACVAGWLTVGPLGEYGQLTRLRDHGATAPAHVTSNRIDATGRFSADVITYDFQPGGAGPPVTSVERFHSNDHEGGNAAEFITAFSQGTLAVRYLPQDPSVNRLDVWFPERIRHNAWNGFPCLAAAVLFGLGGAILLMRGFARRG